MQTNAQEGFTLVEVLIALVVFSLGMLGIAMHTTLSLKSKINNHVHSSAMQIASQYVEPLSRALNISPAAFQSTLQSLQSRGDDTPLYTEGNPLAENFQIKILDAKDRNDNSLLSTQMENWAAPFTIVMSIAYTGENGTVLTFPTTHVLAP